MSYRSVKYSIDELLQEEAVVLRHKLIAYALKNGGFIAGGFARQVFTKQSILKYIEDSNGDVDIFFRNSDDYAAVRAFANEYVGGQELSLKTTANLARSLAPSLPGFCTDIRIPSGEFFTHRSFSHLKIQLVNIFHGEVEDVLDTFDIENCKVAITNDHIVYSIKIPDLELLSTMLVTHGNSPLLANRILKYKFRRKLTSFHPDSSSIMRDWLINWRANKWKDHPLAPRFEHSSLLFDDNVKQLIRYPTLVNDDHLALVFGKLTYRKNMGSSYHPWYQEFDAGIEELKRRNHIAQ